MFLPCVHFFACVAREGVYRVVSVLIFEANKEAESSHIVVVDCVHICRTPDLPETFAGQCQTRSVGHIEIVSDGLQYVHWEGTKEGVFLVTLWHRCRVGALELGRKRRKREDFKFFMMSWRKEDRLACMRDENTGGIRKAASGGGPDEVGPWYEEGQKEGGIVETTSDGSTRKRLFSRFERLKKTERSRETVKDCSSAEVCDTEESLEG
jgi:hypothetical protein